MENCKGFMVYGIQRDSDGNSEPILCQQIFETRDAALAVAIETLMEEVQELSEYYNVGDITFDEDELEVYVDEDYCGMILRIDEVY
jgi:hypothetical protein